MRFEKYTPGRVNLYALRAAGSEMIFQEEDHRNMDTRPCFTSIDREATERASGNK